MSETTASTEYTAVIFDETDVFSAEQEQTLLESMNELSEYGNVGITTLVSYEGLSYDIISDIYYEKFGDTSGIMIFIETKNSAMRIYCNGDMTSTLDTAALKDITNASAGYATEGKYYTCAETFLSETHHYFFNAEVSGPMKIISSALLAVILGLTITYFIVKIFYGRKAAKEEEVLGSIYTQFRLTEPSLDHTGTTTLVKVPKRIRRGYAFDDFFDSTIDHFNKL